MEKKRIRDYGVSVGRMKTGVRNKITDVQGVTVGQVTIKDSEHRTGVTVIMPGQDNPFVNKYTAACYVHNGFGKSAGLVQIEELGTLETPIALTSTLNVGLVWDGIAEYVIDRCRREGVNAASLNPIVGECNDSSLSRIQDRVVKQSHVLEAIRTAGEDFEEGDVGAGSGTICYGLKGGIGSASRIVTIGDTEYTIGVLVQSNFGSTIDLVLNGEMAGEKILKMKEARNDMAVSREDKGSIMTILATDLPVDSRQLRRILRRTAVGIARTGAYTGHGSGEVMIGFTTANRVPTEEWIKRTAADSAGQSGKTAEPAAQSENMADSAAQSGKTAEPAAWNENTVSSDFRRGLLTRTVIREDLINQAFQAAAEAANEAILNSMVCAERAAGLDGKVYYSLAEFLPEALN